MEILRVSRSTLYNYMRQGIIKAERKPNGQWDYDDESVYEYFNRGMKRKTVIYARVSTYKQRKDLDSQIDMLKQWCLMNGVQIGGVYKDIASGITYERRDEFFQMLDDIIARKIGAVVISYKDRLSRVGFDLFKRLFAKYGCEIIVVSELGSEKLDSEEVFEEIVALLHCYSMKLYSNRRKSKVRELTKPEK